MSDSSNSPSMKLVASCELCGAVIDSASTGVSTAAEAEGRILCNKCKGNNQTEQATTDSAQADKAEEVTDPDVPESYEIIEALTSCQNGKAFIVRDKNLDTKLTLRFVTVGVARLTGGLPIETVANLLVTQNHPHLSTVYDWRTDLKTNCLVLDAPPERNVETIIKNEGFLDLSRAIDVFIQACEGLEELHKYNLIHGFIRPRTIGIVESDNKIDTVKLTNFSITNALANDTDQPLKISRNYTCNDVFYMSPEEIRGENPTVASDIYSLGCVIFHAITGKPVYRARTVKEVINLHVDQEPARFRRRYEIPPNEEAVVLRMLEKDPLKRYKSARAIRRDLERLRDKKSPILEDRWRNILSYFGV